MAPRALSWLLAAAAAMTAASVGEEPSFLFLLGDDIGWADFAYNNGTAVTPRISAWARAPGSVLMQDFHSGGTVCSPTRATILTGRNHFRDCVNYVYDCSDMTECVPDFEFAPRRTFTVADAVRATGKGYVSHFGGKWCVTAGGGAPFTAPRASPTPTRHLGSFYNDSEAHGGITSSPVTHGFDLFNATVEVAPTATTNCQCDAAWQASCDYGHNDKMTHCSGGPGPDPNASAGCCFNYWWNDETSAHSVRNFSLPTPDDDATCTPARVAACNETNSTECAPPLPDALPYNHQELDMYACLNELDASVGAVLDALERLGYINNTLTWFTTDNGPEVNCPPVGRCGSGADGKIPPGTEHRPDCGGAASAGPLRGRKRDVWEGGHRVPGIISWPAVVGDAARVSWDPVVTMDFLATVMDVLGVARPPAQADWAFDGVSVLPLLRGETPAERGIGWMYQSPIVSAANGYAYRWGNWKYVVGGISCDPTSPNATFDCSKPQLYDMSVDWAEDHDLSATHPDILAAAAANFSAWHASVMRSIANESQCAKQPPAPPAPFPPSPSPSDTCDFQLGTSLNGADAAAGHVANAATCCGACRAYDGCVAADFWDGVGKGEVNCHLKKSYGPKPAPKNRTACVVPQ